MTESFRITGRKRFPAGAIVMLVPAAIFGLVAIGDDTPSAWLGFVAFLCAALLLLLSQKTPVSAEVNEEGIHFDRGISIPFTDIEGLSVRGVARLSSQGLKPGQIDISHPAGIANLTGKSEPPTPEIFGFLLGKLNCVSRPDLLPSALKGYYDEQADKFGAERVWAFGARNHSPCRPGAPGIIRFGLGLLIAMGIAILGGAIFQVTSDLVAPLAITTGICGAIWLLVGFLANKPIGQGLKKNPLGLVIAPQGIALAQGNTTGQQAWENLNGTALRDRGPATGIQLLIPGTTLIITDVYSSPLQQIASLIKAYLGPGANAVSPT